MKESNACRLFHCIMCQINETNGGGFEDRRLELDASVTQINRKDSTNAQQSGKLR